MSNATVSAARQRGLFIDGQWAAPHSAVSIPVLSANSGKLIGLAPEAGPVDVDAAVAAARTALDAPGGWGRWPQRKRAAALRRFAGALDARAEEIAALVSDQSGMPILLAEAGDSRHPGQFLRYYADLIEGAHGRNEETLENGDSTALARRLPLGVVAAVVPWYVPNTVAALTYAPALAAGCTVVLKPSPQTALDTVHVAEAAHEAGLPPGVLNICTGGRDTGAHLVAHPDVDKVAFTGSTEVGRQIGEVCGRLLRPVDLELAGKSAALVLDDADLDLRRVGPRLASALFGNNGQSTCVTGRVLAPRGRYEEVVDVVAKLARSLRVGSSLDRVTQVGPSVSERQRKRVEDYIEQGVESDARLVAGGARPPGLREGWFVEPTVFADVDSCHPLARDEIFGPVVTVTPYEDDDDAVRIANDFACALAGSVWTTNHDRGLETARRIMSGSVGINHGAPDVTSPTTMVKAGGIGVTYGPGALESYHRYQSVHL